MTQTLFPKKSERKTDILNIKTDILNTDLCGLMQIKFKSRAKYFMIFIDDESRWYEVHFLRKKSKIFEAFKVLFLKHL